MSSRTTRPILLAGPDAAGFAHAQLTSDVLSLATGRWQWSGWLDPKGRVRALLQVARVDDGLLVLPRGGDGEALANDLKRFVFRSKVTVTVLGASHVADGDAYDDGHARTLDDGTFVFGEGDASIHVGRRDDADAWVARHVHKGYAWLPDEALNELLPPALSMERLGAVAFDKGCFPGQEIAARLHFLGGHKRHLRVVESDAPLREGQSLRIDGRDAGIVLMHNTSASKLTSLVVLDDALSQADTVENEGIRLHVLSTFAA
ncbi:folate-binding protein YgfZ [Luteibacter sp. CQ10]|uniref:CAF17-like 4Fe-4S cluster assembly/insertion protein YgfZ n=1 Tax=Luteibacter sp. CQ10 TaxID=2805821 RepID=UPI0034A1F67C